MRVAVYSRVSTRDKDQNHETQLLRLRDAAKAMGVEIYQEYVDKASARDIAHRTEWRRLLDDASKKKFNQVIVFRMDRAFRSVKDLHDTLSAWDMVGVKFRSLQENFDTGTATGRLMMNMVASFAEFELEIIRERVQAGMDRAKAKGTKSGKGIGRPRADVGVQNVLNAYQDTKSIRAAARAAGCSSGTAWRIIKGVSALTKGLSIMTDSVQKGDGKPASQKFGE
jgi:DNA invertase Pin-like site-specific DNA recombinase